MTDALFSAVEMGGGADDLPGFRLDRLELLNWGTFDQRVWTFRPGGRNGLLTGDIGSGKSTIVDAVTTLLLPAQRISYNKAAGAETRERSLRSYVLGHYKSQRNEETGSSQPVSLRDTTSYSVLLGVFANQGYDTALTCAQVFWTGDAGQPDRFYTTADRDMSIAADFTDFGGDIKTLKRRLRSDGARTFDRFPEYGRDFRRKLGIASEQAMELFHQTVSMKSVGDLNEFVRRHMLEPFDSVSWTEKLIAHFDDLTRAHEAVRRAQDQLAALRPLLDDCDTHDRLRDEINALDGQRSALPFFFAERKAGLLATRIAALEKDLESERTALRSLGEQLGLLRDRATTLTMKRDGLGGARLSELDRLIEDAARARDDRRSRAHRHADLLASAGLTPVETAQEFIARLHEIDQARKSAERQRTERQDRIDELGVEVQQLRQQAGDLNSELKSLRARRSNIPRRSLELREWLSRELNVRESELPFAGELIRVRPEDEAWEGAAERLLRGFALSMLVPQEHYPAVSDWINDHHLRARLVYYPVPVDIEPWPTRTQSPDALASKLEIKSGPFAPWLDRELAKRADYGCVETMDDFRRLPRAVTMAGQVKGSGGRHEKNDTTRIDDRSTYVLGWSNEQKIEALLRRAADVQKRQNAVDAERTRLHGEREDMTRREQTLAVLAETTDFTDLDWQAQVKAISEFEAERRQLEASSSELERLGEELTRCNEEIKRLDSDRDRVNGRIGRIEGDLKSARAAADETARVLAEPRCEQARTHFPALAERFPADAALRPEGCDRAENQAQGVLTEELERRSNRQRTVGNKIINRMSEFRRAYRHETTELDDSVLSAPGYRELHRRLVDDDLPRFQQQFKTYLNTNTIRDIATFQSELRKQEELIRQRVGTINESLLAVEYNPGRYIQLEARPSPNTDVRDFRTQLRDCTTGALSAAPSDQYAEEKFLQVSRIIERFKGRDGQTTTDKEWTKRVTDVRNWFVFSASERWRSDGSEHETYSDSGGKSGGQKEKLAYTILAASLAYQFKLDWGATRSKTFRFAVIDEAFGRGSDESTRFALKLFRLLGLQLMIVTPLQKIHVIEPYVSAVGYVDNPNGRYSRLRTLTIEEYHAERAAHLIAAHGDARP